MSPDRTAALRPARQSETPSLDKYIKEWLFLLFKRIFKRRFHFSGSFCVSGRSGSSRLEEQPERPEPHLGGGATGVRSGACGAERGDRCAPTRGSSPAGKRGGAAAGGRPGRDAQDAPVGTEGRERSGSAGRGPGRSLQRRAGQGAEQAGPGSSVGPEAAGAGLRTAASCWLRRDPEAGRRVGRQGAASERGLGREEARRGAQVRASRSSTLHPSSPAAGSHRSPPRLGLPHPAAAFPINIDIGKLQF